MPIQKVDYRRLEKLHKLSVVLSVILAILSLSWLRSDSFSLTTAYMAKDELASTGGTVLAPASRIAYDLNLRYLLATILLINAALHVLTIMRWRKTYEKGLKNRNNILRWLNLAITGGLLTELVAIISGVRDVLVLKVMGLSVVIGFLLCCIAERATKPKNQPKLLFWSSVFAKALPWLLIIGSLVGTSIYGLERFSWYVYAVVSTLLLASIWSGLVFWRTLMRSGVWSDYNFAEYHYLRLDLLTKVLITVFLIIGLR